MNNFQRVVQQNLRSSTRQISLFKEFKQKGVWKLCTTLEEAVEPSVTSTSFPTENQKDGMEAETTPSDLLSENSGAETGGIAVVGLTF